MRYRCKQYLQVEAVFIRDEINCKTQVPKSARPAHLQDAINNCDHNDSHFT